MSNYLAIATVTAALRLTLQQGIHPDVVGTSVTTLRPDADSGLPNPGVNIFLYQVTPNAALRNTDLPTRSRTGRLTQRPRVALDLHYLFSVYGDDSAFQPQCILGSLVRTLHARPILTRETITATLAAFPVLADSNLHEEVELVKFTPISFSLEELSKLWSVFFETSYTLSVAYMGTVVLIEAEEAPRRPLPVLERTIVALPFQRAQIDEVVSENGDTLPIEMGDTVLIRGSRLSGPIERIRVGVVDDLQPVLNSVTPTQLSLALTDASLRAGVLGVQIVYDNGSTSNVAPLVLRPRITQDIADNYEISVLNVVINPDPSDDTRSATIRVNLDPEVEPEQHVELFLNQRQPMPGPGRAYRFPAEARPAATATIDFNVSGVEQGTYLVRVQVMGAETVLDVDIGGFFFEPFVDIP